jgi:hypothetical protein
MGDAANIVQVNDALSTIAQASKTAAESSTIIADSSKAFKTAAESTKVFVKSFDEASKTIAGS